MKHLALFVLLCTVTVHAAEPFGLVIHLEGEVFVTRGILEFDAQVEEVLMWEDEIETGEDGSLQITFDSSFLSIGPNTYVSFEKELTDEGEELYLMNLEEGSFRSKILNFGSRQFFEVVTEEGRLRVHGTDFVSSFNPDGGEGFNVSVLQGQVAMGSADASMGTAFDGGSEDLGVTMLSQNQVGGLSGAEDINVGDLSFEQVDELKEELPVPGDEDTSLALDDLGFEDVSLDSFVEEIKEEQSEIVDETEPEDDIITETSLILELEIDRPDL